MKLDSKDTVKYGDISYELSNSRPNQSYHSISTEENSIDIPASPGMSGFKRAYVLKEFSEGMSLEEAVDRNYNTELEEMESYSPDLYGFFDEISESAEEIREDIKTMLDEEAFIGINFDDEDSGSKGRLF